MTPSIAPPIKIDYQVIHYSKIFPVRQTPCGKRGPAADDWRYVTCPGCRATLPATA